MRLVKGAYWDTEIKRAQERGLADFPVFTRKPATDLSYLACAKRLLAARPRLYPQFATHNALTVATIVEMAGDKDFEFQRLHGMGEALYAAGARARGLRLPHLCAGRQPQGAARLSRAAASGERRQLLLRQRRQRSRRAGREPARAAGRELFAAGASPRHAEIPLPDADLRRRARIRAASSSAAAPISTR